MADPCRTTGSLCPTFVPDRLVGLTVKRTCTNILCARLPFVLSAPWEASVTLLEATTPVKLPTKRCLYTYVRFQINKGWYFNSDSYHTGVQYSQSPTYPTHHLSKISAKLQ